MSCGERNNWERNNWDGARSLRDPEFHLTDVGQSKFPTTDHEQEDWSLDDDLQVQKYEEPTSPPEVTEFQRLSLVHQFLDYSVSTWALNFDKSFLSPEMELFSQVMEFCRPILESLDQSDQVQCTETKAMACTGLGSGSRYPFWTLANATLTNFRGAFWETGRTLNTDEQRA